MATIQVIIKRQISGELCQIRDTGSRVWDETYSEIVTGISSEEYPGRLTERIPEPD